jgi:hypothetical protein
VDVCVHDGLPGVAADVEPVWTVEGIDWSAAARIGIAPKSRALYIGRAPKNAH